MIGFLNKVLILALLGVCFAQAQADPAAVPTSAPTQSLPATAPTLAPLPTVYTSKIGYTLQRIPGWKDAPTGFQGSDYTCYFPVPSKTKFTTNINILIHAMPAGTGIEELRDAFASDMSKEPDTFKVVRQSQIALAKEEGLRVILNFDSNETPPSIRLYAEEYLILHNGNLYEITYTAPLGEEQTHLSEFYDMIHSLKWIPMTPSPADATPPTQPSSL